MDAMTRFETAVEEAITKHADSERENDSLKGAILQAADQLLEDCAVEIARAPNIAMGMTLKGIYETGRYPGKLTEPILHELAIILLQARQRITDAEGDNGQT